jgi:hypothetical protein
VYDGETDLLRDLSSPDPDDLPGLPRLIRLVSWLVFVGYHVEYSRLETSSSSITDGALEVMTQRASVSAFRLGPSLLVAVVALLVTGASCQNPSGPKTTIRESSHEPADTDAETISKQDALKIARADATDAYKDLSDYRVEVRFDGENWHVQYAPPRGHNGGGPEDVISGDDGEIVDKKYWQ